MAGRLEEKVAVVTGASQGIGEAVARLFAEQGARLVLSERVEDSLDQLRAVTDDIATRHPGSRAVAVITDVTDPAACDALMQRAVDEHGRLDTVAHATVVAQKEGPTVDLAPEEWDRVMDVNAKGCFLLSRSAIPRLTSPGGTLVFTGSYHGLVGHGEMAAYCASKGALRLFTQSLAVELADRGIRVNGVAPALVEAEIVRRRLQTLADREGISLDEAVARRHADVPMRRSAQAAEVAEAFLFLVGPESSYVTGTWLDVNGGLVLR